MLWLWRGLAEQRAAKAPYSLGPEEKRTERRICVGGGVGTDVLATYALGHEVTAVQYEIDEFCIDLQVKFCC